MSVSTVRIWNFWNFRFGDEWNIDAGADLWKNFWDDELNNGFGFWDCYSFLLRWHPSCAYFEVKIKRKDQMEREIWYTGFWCTESDTNTHHQSSVGFPYWSIRQTIRTTLKTTARSNRITTIPSEGIWWRRWSSGSGTHNCDSWLEWKFAKKCV